jgi:uncharacterized SAM-binding protein YcdF (DUF218 family)
MRTPPLTDALRADAKALWDFHRLGLPYEKADVLLGLGSYDAAVAEHAADLFLKGCGRWLMFTGLASNKDGLLKSPWTAAEAMVFREIAIARGVPATSIITECQATNTSENLRFSRIELNRLGISFSRLLIVTKPNMERRVRATGKKCIPDVVFSVTSPPCSFEEYCFSRFDPTLIVNLMVGDLQRLEVYPLLGFQETEPIPDSVRRAYERLVAAGFTQHIIERQTN